MISSKVSKQLKTTKQQKSLQPMTQLYLKQFFSNYFLKEGQKQIQNFFSTSVQVLDFLIEEYEQKFGIQKTKNSCQNPSNTQIQFQNFYNRLKNLFQVLEDKVIQSEHREEYIQKDEQFQSSDYQDSLFPQSSMTKLGHSKSSQGKTDDELYQLVVQLKRQNQLNKQQVKSLGKQLKQKIRNVKTLQQEIRTGIQNKRNNQNKISEHQNKINNNQSKISDLITNNQALISQKRQLQIQFEDLTRNFNQLCMINQGLQAQIICKNGQIETLQLIEQQMKSVEQQNSELEVRMTLLEDKLNITQSDKLLIQEQHNELLQKMHLLQTDNIRLKNIICKKLACLSSNSTVKYISKKLNTKIDTLPCSTQQTYKQNLIPTTTSKITLESFKQLFETMLKDKNIIGKQIQNQLVKFLGSILKRVKILQMENTKKQ